jgi:hypothetical protein
MEVLPQTGTSYYTWRSQSSAVDLKYTMVVHLVYCYHGAGHCGLWK